MRDGFSLWNPRLVGTAKRRVEEAEYEAKKWKRRYMDLTSRYDAVHRRLMVVEEELMEAQARLTPDPRLAASPVHPDTMIGGAGARTDSG